MNIQTKDLQIGESFFYCPIMNEIYNNLIDIKIIHYEDKEKTKGFYRLIFTKTENNHNMEIILFRNYDSVFYVKDKEIKEKN
jgi:hypothetical protein